MTRPSEILFVDPSVSDLETILGNLRPEVHAVVLDGRRPAAQQVAAALKGREGLDAIMSSLTEHRVASPLTLANGRSRPLIATRIILRRSVVHWRVMATCGFGAVRRR
jgi:Domain of unknown function (DUF4347)